MSLSSKSVPHPDGDEHKGAVEDDSPRPQGELSNQNSSLSGQLGHRSRDEMTNGNDTDFPELGSSPEHTGQHD
ncbi:MAG: hypothetical protein ACYDC6_09165 [Acidobacteriaceae bacterium]